MIVTDKKRHEVAHKLRGLEICELDGEFIDCGEVEDALGLVSDDGAWYEAECVMHLADLIEPDHIGDSNKMVDCDALLELADELEEDACWEIQSPSSASVARRLKDTCDRIREALGV